MPKTVLIIDDQIDLCQTVRVYLEVEGYRALDFQKGSTALEVIEREPVHAVLLDLNLGEGEMGGIKVLESIKKIDSHLPVIILTGDSTARAAVQAMKSGAYHYITKPFDNDEILILVKKAIDEYEKSR